jgi:predicted ribonuclease YlaK
MPNLVADTSALVSLGLAAGSDPDPLSLCLASSQVFVPAAVIAELRATASYDDDLGRAATLVLERTENLSTRSVELDTEFPLDDGENAAVTLANDIDAAIFLYDEFNRLGLIHASLVDTPLVRTPTFSPCSFRRDSCPQTMH